MLDFINPETAEKVGLAILILYIVSQIGFSGASLYYDSFLTDVITEDRTDKVSTMGYAMGYIGGSTIPLRLFLSMAGVDVDMLICLSVVFGFTSVWWMIFSIPLLKNVQQKSGVEKEKHAIASALKGLGNAEILLALLLVQVLRLPFCLLYINLSERFSPQVRIGVGICIYMGISVFRFFVRSVWQFWVLAILVATSQGGIQALSRSMFGKMIPDKKRSGEFFGFYDIFGRFSAIMGPSLVALSSGWAAAVIRHKENILVGAPSEVLVEVSQRATPWGVLSVLIIFLVGAFLYFVCLPKYLKKEQQITHA